MRIVAAALLLGVVVQAKERSMVDELIAASQRGELFIQTDHDLHGIALTDEEAARAAAWVAQHPDHTSYHLVLALRSRAPARYREVPAAARAAVLCAALQHLQLFNDWGHLIDTPGDGPAVAALVDAGPAALVCLRPLLDDTRPKRQSGFAARAEPSSLSARNSVAPASRTAAVRRQRGRRDVA
jgi:hypothetical protein